MKVPFVDLKPTAALVQAPVLAHWQRAVEATQFVGGPAVTGFEAALAGKLQVEHAISCANGTDAILIGLQALGIGAGHKVAVPNLTFWATYEAVAQLGATPVLIDVDAGDLQMDLEELQAAHERIGLDAVVLVHLMGWASGRLEAFRRWCAERELPLVEDGAQSYGVEVGGRSVYSGARVATLSFYPAKVLGGCMDGGAITTNDASVAEAARNLCNHGRATHFSYSRVGWNSRMSGLQASWLSELLTHSDAILAQRRTFAQRYQALFAELGEQVVGHGPGAGVTENGYLAVCELRKGEPGQLGAALGNAGVGHGRVYPQTLDQQPPASGALRVSELARSRKFCERVLNLPLFYGMTDEQFNHVAGAFRAAVLEAR
jgi:dTDP-4-amino-4,6-dideoxygalactose transaminase